MRSCHSVANVRDSQRDPSCAGFGHTGSSAADWRYLRWRCSFTCRLPTFTPTTFTARSAGHCPRPKRSAFLQQNHLSPFQRISPGTVAMRCARSARRYTSSVIRQLPTRRKFSRFRSLFGRPNIRPSAQGFSSHHDAPLSNLAPRRPLSSRPRTRAFA